jgi:FkbM family methyltransferase
LKALLRLAGLARKAGLGAVIDRLRPAVLPLLARRPVRVDGLMLAGETIEDRLYYQQLSEGRESFMAELFTRLAKPGDTVVDIGAHLGYFSLLAARRVRPGGRVFAFEPNPETLGRLRANLERNGAADVVTVVPAAVADVPGRRSFYLREGADVSSLYSDEAYTSQVEVETVAGDAFFEDAGAFDLLKVDVEGAEPSVLAGLARSLDRAGLKAFVECNPEALEAAGSSVDALVGVLEQAGFRVSVIDEERRVLRPVAGAAELWPYVNLFCER